MAGDKMWQNIDELIAIIIVIGCLTFIGLGIDSQAWGILGMSATWVFSREVHKKRGKRK